MKEIKKKQPLSFPEVKALLEVNDIESMDQIQRWTYDYIKKFVDMDSKDAKKMREDLVKDCDLTDEEAAELVNIRPTTLAELRSFTFGWKKLILAETLEKILTILTK